jgi:hypothetical protein
MFFLFFVTKTLWSQCPNYISERQVFWGDLHVHTHLSMDAAIQGTTTTSLQAYDFAQGKEVSLDNLIKPVQLEEPLDFVSITDHSEMLGELEICRTPHLKGYKSIACRTYRNFDDTAYLWLNSRLALRPKPYRKDLARMPFCGWKGERCEKVATKVWQMTVKEAQKHNNPCEFTVFPGYEWSGSPHLQNIHRNVIFEDFDVPKQPVSYLDAPRDLQLWKELDDVCQGDCEYMTIPHNSNLSSGTMFPSLVELSEEPYAEYISYRSSKEPIMEVFQHKGSSECGPTKIDPECSFEYVPYNNLGVDRFWGLLSGPPTNKDFLRYALTEGMIFEDQGLDNPYKYGVIGSSDTHLGIPGAVDENQFYGHGGAGKIEQNEIADVPYFNPGGLVAVWAEENTQSSIFDALERKEVYATSGPRFELRFFASTSEITSQCGSEEWLAEAYQKGVPMGGSVDEHLDIFFYIQVKAPQDHPIERIQMIQGWADGKKHNQSVQTIWYESEGSHFQCYSLQMTVPESSWTYIRVLATPTKRWSPCENAGRKCPKEIPITIHERAWSSPIWFYGSK